MPPTKDTVGGAGGHREPREPRKARLMECRAIRERWPLPATKRRAILKRLMEVVDPPKDSPLVYKTQEVIASARALISADRINIEQARLEQAERAVVDNAPARVDADVIDRAEAIRAAREARSQSPGPADSSS